MSKARCTDASVSFEDRRMWRLLLAQLHPDAGGNHELFTFACTVREEVCGKEPHRGKAAYPRERRVEHFLRGWQDAINSWASRNRDALRNL